MKKLLPLFPLLLLLSLGGAVPGFAQARKAPAGDAEFKELIRRYYEAWNAGPDKAAVLYAKEPDLVFFDIAPLKYTGWDEYKTGVQKMLFDNMASGSLVPKDDLRVTRKGNVGWTMVTGHMSAKMKDGSSLEKDFRHTAIWEKRNGQWLIVHEHFSTPMQ